MIRQGLRLGGACRNLPGLKPCNLKRSMKSIPRKNSRRGMEAFASRDFRRFQLARGVSVLATEAQAVAVAWQVYSITHRALDLGYTGLALFLPGLLFLLPAGHAADRYDRRHVVLVCYSLQISRLLRCFGSLGGELPASTPSTRFCLSSARAALLRARPPRLLFPTWCRKMHLMNAITWTGVAWQLANITGPALGGILFTLPLATFCPTFCPSRGLKEPAWSIFSPWSCWAGTWL